MISVVLLMAGTGSRMGANKNKILLEANNKMLFEYPLELFKKYNFEIVCVINKNDEQLLMPYLKNVKYTIGGATRGDSVYNGLLKCSGDYVLIHDSARVLLSSKVIDKIIELKDNFEAVLTYCKVKDTIKEIDNGKLITLNRDNLIAASTPQCGKLEYLKRAYQLAKKDNKTFTDDISLIEHYYPNIRIGLVEANEENFKVTTPIDYKIIKELIK
ncbi:MAG: 2-C-methyl-D-erythritol 4-phosphate cytidylyltransferase [Acholeplasmatales bacterium]|nr:2-C-methyl-D-erythritol 4-phosphate cytidylyltransferase [Acholeplasmatales bacterium]